MWVFFLTAVLAVTAAVIVQRLASATEARLLREIEREEMQVLERTGQRIAGSASGSFGIWVTGVFGGSTLLGLRGWPRRTS